MTTTSIQTIATEARSHFHQSKRNDGTEFWSFDHNTTPAWIIDMAHEAHGDMAPDDWKYAFIVEALDAFADTEDADDVNLDADVYTHDLLRWLASNLQRPGYCDQAMEEYGMEEYKDLVSHVSQGQAYEKSEVLNIVRSALVALTDSDDNA